MSEQPDMIDGRFEIYRVVTDYAALCEAFSERVEDLQATRLGVDAAGGFALGHASTLLCRPQIKGYGPESLTHMLKATGMALVFVIDDERFAAVKEKLGKRVRPIRSPSNVGQSRPKWLFTPKKASKMRAKWWDSLSDAQKKRHQIKAQRGQAAARRRARREREQAGRKSEVTA